MQINILIDRRTNATLTFNYVPNTNSHNPTGPFVFKTDDIPAIVPEGMTSEACDREMESHILGFLRSHPQIKAYNVAHESSKFGCEYTVNKKIIQLDDEGGKCPAREYILTFSNITAEELQKWFPDAPNVSSDHSSPGSSLHTSDDDDPLHPGSDAQPLRPSGSAIPTSSLVQINKDFDSCVDWFQRTFEITLTLNDVEGAGYKRNDKGKLAYKGEGIKNTRAFAVQYITGSRTGCGDDAPGPLSSVSGSPSQTEALLLPDKRKKVTPHWSIYEIELNAALNDFRDNILDKIQEVDDIRDQLAKSSANSANAAEPTTRQQSLQRKMKARQDELTSILTVYRNLFRYLDEQNKLPDVDPKVRFQNKMDAIEQCRNNLISLGWKARLVVGFCVFLGFLIGAVAGFFIGSAIGSLFGAVGGTAFMPLVGTVQGAIAGGSIAGIWGTIKGAGFGGAIGATVGSAAVALLGFGASHTIAKYADPMRRSHLRFFHSCDVLLEHGEELRKLGPDVAIAPDGSGVKPEPANSALVPPPPSPAPLAPPAPTL